MESRKLAVTCPLCGRKNDFPLESLAEGKVMQCPACNVKLTLHGHMWEEIKGDLERLKDQQ